MGNQSWTCRYCNYINFDNEISRCMSCAHERTTAYHTDKNGGLVVLNNSDFLLHAHNNSHNRSFAAAKLKVIEVNKSSELHLKLLEKAAHQNVTTGHGTAGADGHGLTTWYDHEFPPEKKSLFVKKKPFKLSSLPIFLQSNGLKKAKYWLRPGDINFTNPEYDEDDEDEDEEGNVSEAVGGSGVGGSGANRSGLNNAPHNTSTHSYESNGVGQQKRHMPISLYSNSSSTDVLQGGLGSCELTLFSLIFIKLNMLIEHSVNPD
jgi:hypothetical protein